MRIILNFPASSKVNRFIPKETFADKLDLTTKLKESLKDDIKKFTITNELSPRSVNIEKGETVSGIFVMEVLLKERGIDFKIIEAVAKQNKNKILFVLRYEDEARLAIFHGKLYCSERSDTDSLNCDIIGLNMDEVWKNLVEQIAIVRDTPAIASLASDIPIDERLNRQEELQKLQKLLDRLEKQAWNERQPKKKFELVGRIDEIKRKLEGLQ